MPHTARGRSGRIWPPTAGTFARITDGPRGLAATSRAVTARQVRCRHRATSIISITLSYGRARRTLAEPLVAYQQGLNAGRVADGADLASLCVLGRLGQESLACLLSVR
jgi:hypothetical protein